jgi:hypothetical protein
LNPARPLTDEQRQQLERWLGETGELFIDLYPPLRFFTNLDPPRAGTRFFVRSVAAVEDIIAWEIHEPIAESRRLGFTVRAYRRLQYPLRGIAGPALLQTVLEQLPEEDYYTIVSLDHYYPPFPVVWVGAACNRAEFEEEFRKLSGQRVAVGQTYGDLGAPEFVSNPDEIMEWRYERKGDHHELASD